MHISKIITTFAVEINNNFKHKIMTNEIRTDFYKNVRNEIENKINGLDADMIPSYLENLANTNSKEYKDLFTSLKEEYDYYFLEEELDDIVFNVVSDLEMNW